MQHQFSFDGTELIGYKQPDFSFIFSDLKYGQHIEILGATGSGKTNLTIWFYSECPKRMVVFNPLRIIEYEMFSDIVLNERDLINKGLTYYLDSGYRKICITLSEKYLTNERKIIRRFFDEHIAKPIFYYEDKVYTDWMRAKNFQLDVHFRRKAHIMLMVDELLYVSSGENMLPYHNTILFAGRNHGISHIGLTQRNQHISKLITTQSQIKILLELDLYDINALKDKIRNINIVENLKKYHFIIQKGERDIKFYSPVPDMMHSSVIHDKYKV